MRCKRKAANEKIPRLRDTDWQRRPRSFVFYLLISAFFLPRPACLLANAFGVAASATQANDAHLCPGALAPNADGNRLVECAQPEETILFSRFSLLLWLEQRRLFHRDKVLRCPRRHIGRIVMHVARNRCCCEQR